MTLKPPAFVVSALLICLLLSCERAPLVNKTSGEVPDQLNPVIVIPGMLGSALADLHTQEELWGRSDSLGLYPQELAVSRRLAMPFRSIDAQPERPKVEAHRVLRRVHPKILFINLERTIYEDLFNNLEVGGYDFEGATEGAPRGLEFPYDWRSDVVEVAAELSVFIATKKLEIEAERRTLYRENAKPVVFDIVAHSLGGLIARYYMMYGDTPLLEAIASKPSWAGAKNIERIIYVVPPNGGSADALTALLNGRDFGFLQPVFDPVVMSTYMNVFQLMPRRGEPTLFIKGRPGTVDAYDPKVWRENNLGLFAPDMIERLRNLTPDLPDDAARYELAFEHIAASLFRAEAFHKALDQDGQTPAHTQSFLVLGGGENTETQVEADPASGASHPVQFTVGDSSVAHSSSYYLSNLSKTTPGPLNYRDVLIEDAGHLEVTQSRHVGQKILQWLSGAAVPLGN